MFTLFDLPRAVPSRLVGMPYGMALTLPQFIGVGVFCVEPDAPPTEDDVSRDRWADDGGPCAPEED